MAIGAVLLRPQFLRQPASARTAAASGQDVLTLLFCVLRDVAQGRPLLIEVEGAAQALALRLLARVPRDAVKARLSGLLEPLSKKLAEAAGKIRGEDGPGELVTQLAALLSSVLSGLGAPPLDTIRSHAATILTLIEEDLGLTPAALRDGVREFLEDLLARVERPILDETPAQRDNRLAFSGVLRRLRRVLLHLEVPRFTAEDVTTLVRRLVADLSRQKGLGQAACIGAGLTNVFRASEALVDLVPFGAEPSFGPGSLGAGEAKPKDLYCWYASWLLPYHRPGAQSALASFFGWPFDVVKVDAARTQVVLRNVVRSDHVLHSGKNLSWTDAPIFKVPEVGKPAPHYAWKNISPETMEKIAYHSAWSADALETLLHLVVMREGRYLPRTFDALWGLSHLVVELCMDRPLRDVMPGSYPVKWTGSLVLSVLTSLLGMHTKAKRWYNFYFFVLLAPNLGVKWLIAYYAKLVRDLLLATLTLLNHEEGAENVRHIDAWASLGVDLFLMILIGAVMPRTQYGIERGVGLILGYGVGLSMLFGLLGSFLGSLVGWFFAGMPMESGFAQALGKSLLRSLAWSVGRFWPYAFLLKDAATDDGTYSPIGAAYSGYPDAATDSPSPYLLPYRQGLSLMVSQGNQGLWSHYYNPDKNITVQVYSFDFGHEEDEEILASRPGTVVSYGDQKDNDARDDWNYVIIRHDVDDQGTAVNPDPNYDKVQSGAVRVTYAVYGHGRKGSVTEFLGASPVGKTVKRGQPIMRAGDTGNSFHNHLHMHVQAQVSSTAVITSVTGTSDASLSQSTIPFVFQETSGPLRKFRAYTSKNARTP